MLALLAHHFLHVSRIRVKSLTLRLLMSYIYIYIYIYIYDISRLRVNTPLNHPSERTVRSDSCLFRNRSREFRFWETVTLPTQENNNLGKTHTNIHALVGFQLTTAMCVQYKTGCEATMVSNSLHLLLDAQKTAFQLRGSLGAVRGP